ncbi:MAG: DUF924 domain-containing protein [gamma proteobacterium symbiont of Taylorina sp.]|nr:DUF924 domain-containing protein [gamma proteobacterium symbiont of Taylorina sp.]
MNNILENTTPDDIITFWYSPRVKQQWFKSTTELDKEIHDKYCLLWKQAASGELDSWAVSAAGSLSLAIILDQFPLNMFRGQAKSFSTEKKAINISKAAISKSLDEQLTIEQKVFLYIPLMHSEEISIQNQSVELFKHTGLESNLRFARHHRSIIERFGRFPHRNSVLDRKSSSEEISYLHSKEAFLG